MGYMQRTTFVCVCMSHVKISDKIKILLFFYSLGSTTFSPLPVQAPLIKDHKPLLGLRKIPFDNDRTGRCACWALELPFEWTEIYKDGYHHLNADAMSRCPADTRPTDQNTSCTAPASSHPDKRHSSPVSPSCSVSSVHHHSSCRTVPEPVSCNQTKRQPSFQICSILHSLSLPHACFSSLKKILNGNNNEILYCLRL